MTTKNNELTILVGLGTVNTNNSDLMIAVLESNDEECSDSCSLCLDSGDDQCLTCKDSNKK